MRPSAVRSISLAVVAAAAALLLAPPANAGPRKASGKKKAPATGTIEGTIRFAGTPPKAAPIPATQDPYCAKKKIVDEKVVVTGGMLRDVYVGLPAGKGGSHTAPATPVVVDQSGCMYRPRVVGVMAGQKLEIRNSDHTFHNVRGTEGKRTVFNHGQPQKFPPVDETAGKPGQVLTLRCDIHPWMRGYAVVTDHPYFAVTGADGTFVLKDVPAGTHTVEAWHPELGKLTATVKVRPGKTAKVELTYR